MHLRQWLVRLMPWVDRGRVDREVARELDLHLELEIRQNLECGMSPRRTACRSWPRRDACWS